MDLALDGVYANTGNPITVAVNAFSLEMLVWIWQELTTLGILMQVQNANQIALYNGGADWRFLYNTVVLTNATNHTAQRWHHLVATYDGANMRLYVDNTAAGPAAAGVQANVSTLLEISTNQSLSNWGHAFYAEIAVYAAALSAARVAAHFAAIDQVANVPVFSSAAGTPAAPSTQLASILAAVQATYQNAP
jgi:hypothetical protein